MSTFFRKLSRKSSGFTLIELLVVVSIIGMFSSVVLASLDSARGKAKDAAIKEGVQQLAILMEYEYSTYASYAALQTQVGDWYETPAECSVGGGIPSSAGSFSGNVNAQNICANIVTNNGGTGIGNYKGMHVGTPYGVVNDFSIMVYLPGAGKYFCVGSSGGVSDTETGTPWDDPGCYANP